MTEKTQTISERFIKTICSRLENNKQVRRSLPGWGRVHIDRQLPFLCIYRRRNEDDKSLFERFVMGEAAYLTAPGNRRQHRQLSALVKDIILTLKESFGSFLIIEIWAAPENESDHDLSPYQPAFKIIRSRKSSIMSTIETLERELNVIKIRKKTAITEVVESSKISPPGLAPILPLSELKKLGCHIIGLEVRPIFQNNKTGQLYPLIRRELQRNITRVLKNSFFEFTHHHTPYRPLHYLSLGRLSMVKAVWEADKQLANINSGFDFLLQVTPTNIDSAWSVFKKNHFDKTPAFSYRPLPIDPSLAKRKLYNVPIERIEDPSLAQLFREQQLELDRKFTMLIDRNTKSFMYGSLQLFGAVEKSLLKLSEDLLSQLPPHSREGSNKRSVDAKTFATHAADELNYFRKKLPENKSKILVRQDISGLMVSQGNLLIGTRVKIPQSRVNALIQHEVGTHVLTYLNGKAQPFRQLYLGLAGYEELQEGLAVLSEFMVDGLTKKRLRLLAVRVIAASRMISGASFIDVFRELNSDYGFERYTAFTITTRTFRCGGLTKDAVYMRGLVQLLAYLKNGGSLEPLFVGKISVDHVNIIKELQWRKILHPAPLRPRYLEASKVNNKLEELRKGLSPINLIVRR